jgi:hypothetical protein
MTVALNATSSDGILSPNRYTKSNDSFGLIKLFWRFASTATELVDNLFRF